jgi:hypothetical protein
MNALSVGSKYYLGVSEMAIKKVFNARNLMRFVFFAFIVSTVVTIIEIIIAPTVAPYTGSVERVKGDYIYLLIQCVIGLIIMLFPGYLHRKAKLEIPSLMIIIYALFVLCALYLGFVRGFYERVPHWDTITHIFSGVGLGALGFSVVSLLNKSDSITFSLSPAFVAIFAFCFAVSLGVVWEIFEYAVDCLLGANMQKFALESGEPLIGQAALADTMKDLIVDAIGAFVMSLIGYISLKYKKGWIEKVQVKQRTH